MQNTWFLGDKDSPPSQYTMLTSNPHVLPPWAYRLSTKEVSDRDFSVRVAQHKVRQTVAKQINWGAKRFASFFNRTYYYIDALSSFHGCWDIAIFSRAGKQLIRASFHSEHIEALSSLYVELMGAYIFEDDQKPLVLEDFDFSKVRKLGSDFLIVEFGCFVPDLLATGRHKWPHCVVLLPHMDSFMLRRYADGRVILNEKIVDYLVVTPLTKKRMAQANVVDLADLQFADAPFISTIRNFRDRAMLLSILVLTYYNTVDQVYFFPTLTIGYDDSVQKYMAS